MLQVFHLNRDSDLGRDLRFDGDPIIAAQAIARGHYTHVADVHTDNREVAFDVTQNIEASWVEIGGHGIHRARIDAKVEEARSTSVGDLVGNEGSIYVVAPVGFEYDHEANQASDLGLHPVGPDCAAAIGWIYVHTDGCQR
mgnify:CR=1 FL=1